MVEASMATTIRSRPVLIWNVLADTPEPPHGDTDEKPMPAPNARRTRVRAAAATAPATTAAHDTAGLSSAGVETSTASIVSKTINAPLDECPSAFLLRARS